MAEQPTQEPPEFNVRPGDASWLASLSRATESVKHDWRAIHCLVNQRRGDVAPVVLETIRGECLRSPLKYESAFELCLRHLHGRHTPLDVACTVGALLSNRAAHALKLPGRWVPTPDGVVDYATQSTCQGEEALVATTTHNEQSSTDEEEDASKPLEVTTPGTSVVLSSELLKLATHESIAEEDDTDKDSIGSCVVPNEEEEGEEHENEELPICAEDREENASVRSEDEDVPTSICSESGVTTQVVDLSHTEELSHKRNLACAGGRHPSVG